MTTNKPTPAVVPDWTPGTFTITDETGRLLSEEFTEYLDAIDRAKELGERDRVVLYKNSTIPMAFFGPQGWQGPRRRQRQ